MIKAIPSKNEMRILVKTIYETALKLNGQIQINSLDDAATFAAYLYGFSSWKEYQSVYQAEYESQIKEDFIIKMPKFKTKNIKTHANFLNTINVLPIIKKIELKEANLIPLEWLLGKKRNIIAKIDEPIGLLTNDYIITSGPLAGALHLLENNLKWLIKYQQTFILFGLDNKDKSLIGILNDNNDILKIGKNGFKIDPIEESFESDGFESLLGITPFGEHQTFTWVWTMMVRVLRSEFNVKWTAKKLLESLRVENLIEIKDKIKNINPLIANSISQYLKKQCEITQIEDGFLLSEDGQAKHYNQVYLIRERLEKLLELYNLGYFSDNTNISIKKCVFEKISAVILDCEDEKLKKLYWEACNISYVVAIKKQNKMVSLLDSSKYRVWGLWWHAENIISEELSIELVENKETAILGLYVLSANHNLDSCFTKINQIVFLRQQFSHYPQKWCDRALLVTEFWENNMWFDNYAIFKNLKLGEAYVWKQKSLSYPEDIGSYEFKKIELYVNDPMKS
jgi:hypothetical protein